MILLANLLTLSRIPLGLLFWVVTDRPGLAIAILVTGGVTDVIDGPIARHARRIQSRHAPQQGQPPAEPGIFSWLDPLCDKFFVVSVLLATYVTKEVPLGVMLAIAARELVQVPLAAIYRFTPLLRARMRYDFTAGPMGKAATVAQFITLAAILMNLPFQEALAGLTAVVGLIAAAHYIARGIRLARARGLGTPSFAQS